eukprot:TRINITY_DN1220_c0_g1_i1.p1 TRINITY_DN1220_c0_g1~~TRINITY_DN1220_c0_g1_i1.p1  ORF type:complete len:176 (+),score=43.62 TRINITY_DN1220_c0_g1_i1:124-651(+)
MRGRSGEVENKKKWVIIDLFVRPPPARRMLREKEREKIQMLPFAMTMHFTLHLWCFTLSVILHTRVPSPTGDARQPSCPFPLDKPPTKRSFLDSSFPRTKSAESNTYRFLRGMSIGEVLGDTSGDICRASRLDSSPSMEGVGVRAGVETGLRSRTGVPRTSASSSTSMSIATIWR